jgi:tetratricopeptide (TPR) repeat protein
MDMLRVSWTLCLLAVAAGQAAASDVKTVIGPTNAALADGAAALIAGDAEEGVRLTLEGLSRPTSERDRIAAWANLCAGYVMLEQFDSALAYCDRVIAVDDDNWRAFNNRALVHIFRGDYAAAASDIDRVESLRPNARTLDRVRTMLLNETDPVRPTVVIDDRRQAPE